MKSMLASVAAFALLMGASVPSLDPNPILTPGVVADTNQAEVCARGGSTYSQTHRLTTEALKDWVMREYGLSTRVGLEIDHRVPLCLGGADEAANLWPQSYSGPWNAHLKDKLEAYACREVCAGKVPLATAQAWFLSDWRTQYTVLFGAP